MRNASAFVVLVAGLGAVAWLVVCSAAPAQTGSPPATRPSTQPLRDWFRMSPDEFAQTEAANRQLPWADVDDRLLSAAILHETNRRRTEHQRPPLRHMPKLDEAAAMHAEDMVAGNFFSHENPNDPKKRTVLDRVKLLGLTPMFAGENIITEHGIRYEPRRKVYDTARDGEDGLSYEPDGEPIPPHTYLSFAQRVVQRWMDSPPHRENILSPHARFLGSAARGGRGEKDARFRKFYVAQVFFAPMPR